MIQVTLSRLCSCCLTSRNDIELPFHPHHGLGHAASALPSTTSIGNQTAFSTARVRPPPPTLLPLVPALGVSLLTPRCPPWHTPGQGEATASLESVACVSG